MANTNWSDVTIQRIIAADHSRRVMESELEEIKGEHTEAKRTADERQTALLERIEEVEGEHGANAWPEKETHAIAGLSADYRRAADAFDVVDRDKRRKADQHKKMVERELQLVKDATEDAGLFDEKGKKKSDPKAWSKVLLADILGSDLYAKPFIECGINNVGALVEQWKSGELEAQIAAGEITRETVYEACERVRSYVEGSSIAESLPTKNPGAGKGGKKPKPAAKPGEKGELDMDELVRIHQDDPRAGKARNVTVMTNSIILSNHTGDDARAAQWVGESKDFPPVLPGDIRVADYSELVDKWDGDWFKTPLDAWCEEHMNEIGVGADLIGANLDLFRRIGVDNVYHFAAMLAYLGSDPAVFNPNHKHGTERIRHLRALFGIAEQPTAPQSFSVDFIKGLLGTVIDRAQTRGTAMILALLDELQNDDDVRQEFNEIRPNALAGVGREPELCIARDPKIRAERAAAIKAGLSTRATKKKATSKKKASSKKKATRKKTSKKKSSRKTKATAK